MLLASNVGYLVNLAALVVVLLTGVELLWPALVPVIGRDEVRTPAVSVLVGNAPGRSWAILMVVGGVLVALFVLLASRSIHLRRVQNDLPDDIADATPDDRPTPAAPSLPVQAPAPAQR